MLLAKCCWHAKRDWKHPLACDLFSELTAKCHWKEILEKFHCERLVEVRNGERGKMPQFIAYMRKLKINFEYFPDANHNDETRK